MDCQCRQCGNCCRVEGYVRLRPGEDEALAACLGLDVYEFTRRHTRLTADRRGLSLAEKADGSCVFLGEDGRCVVQAVKPAQCRAFPTEWSFAGYEEICAARGGPNDET